MTASDAMNEYNPPFEEQNLHITNQVKELQLAPSEQICFKLWP